MPAKAGIQVVENNPNMKGLDSRLHGNDDLASLHTASGSRERRGETAEAKEAVYFFAGAVLAGGFSAGAAAAGVQKGLSGMTSFFTFSSVVL